MDSSTLLVANDQSSAACAESAAEWDEVLEWLCYVKPIGPGMTVTARESPDRDLVGQVRICGSEPSPLDSATAAHPDECRSSVCGPFLTRELM